MKRRLLRGSAYLLLVLLAIGIAAPFLSADRYRTRIEDALSNALGRRVEVGHVSLDLFTGPGFSASNVIIADNPPGADNSPGAEPFTYVGELRAVPRIWSLWTGHLEFASLTLEDAHVNLRRSLTSGQSPTWNFESLLRPRLLATFPNIRLRGARINFTMGNVKSAFYLLDTDLDISPRAHDGTDWELSFTGEPARADRPAHGFGAIAAKGRWKRPPGGVGHLELDAKLDRSEIGDMVALVNGRDAGIHGLISGQIHVAGPPDAVGVEGEVRVSELHGWEQSPPSGGVFAFRVSGAVNTSSQHLELFAEPRGGQNLVKAHLVADGYLERPAWDFELHSDALPVASLPGLFRNFGASIPEDLRLSGTMQGDLRYAATSGWSGSGSIQDAALTIKNFPVLTFEPAAIEVGSEVAGFTARLLPVRMISGTETIGTLGGNYAVKDGSFEVDLSSAGGPFAGLLKTFPVASVPLLSTLVSASWKGDLRFLQSNSAPGRWTGAGELTDAAARIPALSEPLHIASGNVQIDGDAILIDRMKVSAGSVEAEGNYRYVPNADRPHQFHLTMQTADLAQLEALLRPTLRRSTNIFDLALTLGRIPVPEWLRTMHADGSIQVNTLVVAGSELNRVRSHVQWDSTEIVFPDWQSRFEKASIATRINVDLRGAAPQYAASARLNGMAWQGGRVDANLRAKSHGTGLEVVTGLQVTGSFRGHDLNIDPLGPIDSLTGEGQVSWNGDAPVFRFPEVRLISSGEIWTGSGSSRGDEVVFELLGNGKTRILAGSLVGPARNWIER